MTKAYLLLSGCGRGDGSEIHEATLALLALDQHHIATQCIAPDIPQKAVYDHFHRTADSTPRQVIVEAARIARGAIVPIDSVAVADADMLVIPGGLGAITTLCSFMEKEALATILPVVQSLIEGFHAAHKPIVPICISPVLIALTFANTHAIRLTLGTNPEYMRFLASKGMEPVSCGSDQHVVDSVHRIVSTPAYNEAVTIATVWKGISSAIDAAVAMLGKGT